jgi:hypothetical protein
MNGPEHYQAAEALLIDCQVPLAGEVVGPETYDADPKVVPALIAGLTHATLALAAATAANQATAYDGDETYVRARGWSGVV